MAQLRSAVLTERDEPGGYYLDNVYVQACNDCSIPNEVRHRKTPPSQFAPFKKQ